MSPNGETQDWDDEVTRSVMQMLQRCLPEYELTLTPRHSLEVRWRPDVPPLLQRDLSDLLAALTEAQHQSRRAEALLSRLADEICAEVAPVPLLPSQPFPILRPASFVTAYGAGALTQGGIGDCKAVLMRQRRDGPPEVLTQTAAGRAALSPQALWAAAHRNLRALAGDLVLQEYDYGIMSIEVAGHDWLGGSLLLSQTVLSRALERLGIDRALVCAPSQISVDLVDLETPDALPRMERWMAERLSEERPLSELVFAAERDGARPVPAYASRGGRLIGAV